MTAAALPLSAAPDRYRFKYIIAITVSLASVLELLDTSIVNVAIPHMMGNLGATLDQIAWVSTGYIVANVIVLPVTGWMSAYFGRRRYFAGSIALFTIASILCGNSHTLAELVIFRVVQGLGGGALLSTAQATLYEVFPPHEYGGAMAIFGLGVMVGPTLGPTFGGWLTDTFSWPWIFYINVPFGALALVLSLAYLRNSRFARRVEAVDWTGLALLAVGLGILPGALASAFPRAAMARTIGRVDGRPIAVLGVGLFAFAMWQWSRFTLQSGFTDFFWPLIARGAALGMVFIPLNNLAVSEL